MRGPEPDASRRGGTRGRRRSPGIHSVFERTLHDVRRALVGWAAGMVALAVVMLAVYPTIRDNTDMNTLLESYPEALRKMFDIEDYTTGAGYLRAEVFSLMAPLLLVILAVLWFSDVIAGEEERRTIDLLLANPVSRRRVLLEKFAGAVVAVVAVVLSLGIAIAVGAPFVSMGIAIADLAAGVVASALLAVVYGSVAFAVAAATGHRGLARGVTVAFAVLSYVVSTLAELVTWLKPLRPLSPWYHALGVDPIGTGLSFGHVAVLLAVVGVALAFAVRRFERRDLAV